VLTNPKPWTGSQAGLGRVVSTPDQRDYPLPRKTKAAEGVTSKYWMSLGAPLDQGGTSMCVAYSGGRMLTTHPIINKLPNLDELYRRCQQLDEWDGEDYDGTSVRGLMKALKERGIVTEYRWAEHTDEVVTYLLARGPMVLGTTWRREMFTPDKWGYIWFEGHEDGGHAYLAVGANRKRKNPDGSVGAIQIINSWGPKWGANGRAWIAFNQLQPMLDDYGEAAAATEFKLAA
jgi:hypothetical protein